MLFIKENIVSILSFNPKDFEFFLEQVSLGEPSTQQIREILTEAKKMPAALRGYHGYYEGGLYDHILLVTNLVFQICKIGEFLTDYLTWLKEKLVPVSENYTDIDLFKAIQTAIYHDFGKIPYYGLKLNLQNRKIYITMGERKQVSRDITKKFNYYGSDSHVEGCIAVLNGYNLPLDDEILQAIIFHHGRWSKYGPFKPNKLSELIHAADMIASQKYNI